MPPDIKKTRWAVLLFLLGISAIYGVEYFGLGFLGLFRVLGGMALVSVLLLNGIALYRDFKPFPITHWGTGLALLLVALRLYVMIEATPRSVQHLSSAKWLVLILSSFGVVCLLYGVFLQFELGAHEVQKSHQKWVNTESLNGLMVATNFLALFILANRFILGPWW